MTVRGQTITDVRTLYVEECCNCGVIFAMDSEYVRQRRQDHNWWYCPNGHSQHYSQESEAEKERRLRVEAERISASRLDDLRIERAAHSATKGTLTKTRKRVANGVCPCCQRSFVNLTRHMSGQHPGYATP